MKEEVTKKEFYNIKELARKMIVSERTIYNKVSSGSFPIRVRRIGRLLRFHVDDVNEYFESI
jgi:excisionase family DNA binding protein